MSRNAFLQPCVDTNVIKLDFVLQQTLEFAGETQPRHELELTYPGDSCFPSSMKMLQGHFASQDFTNHIFVFHTGSSGSLSVKQPRHATVCRVVGVPSCSMTQE